MEAAAAIRALGYDKMIIGLTGCAMDDDKDAYIEAGADLILTKPLNITDLDKVVRFINEHGSESFPNTQLVMDVTGVHRVVCP